MAYEDPCVLTEGFCLYEVYSFIVRGIILCVIVSIHKVSVLNLQ